MDEKLGLKSLAANALKRNTLRNTGETSLKNDGTRAVMKRSHGQPLSLDEKIRLRLVVLVFLVYTLSVVFIG